MRNTGALPFASATRDAYTWSALALRPFTPVEPIAHKLLGNTWLEVATPDLDAVALLAWPTPCSCFQNHAAMSTVLTNATSRCASRPCAPLGPLTIDGEHADAW